MNRSEGQGSIPIRETESKIIEQEMSVDKYGWGNRPS